MKDFLNSLTLHYVLQIIIIIQLLPFSTQGWGNLNECKYNNGFVECDFQRWSPPLMDYEFGPEPVRFLTVFNITGKIPAGVKFQLFFV